MRILIILLVPLFVLSACEKRIEDPLKELQEQDIHALNLILYPSNLKMMNSTNNLQFEEATKEIKKLHLMQIQWDDPSKKQAFAEWKAAQNLSKWEQIFIARIQNANIEIKAPKGQDDILYASADTKDGVFVGFLEGKFDISQVPVLLNEDLDLGLISDFIQDKEKIEAQRTKRGESRDEINSGNKEKNAENVK